MRYIYNQQPKGLRIDAKFALNEEQEAELRDKAWDMIVRGDIEADAFVERLDGEESFSLPDEALSEIFDSMVRARRVQQSAWTEAETKTRLTAAFEDLETQGILCRQNFTCCGTCASAEIYDERSEGKTWRGYLWYHMQDVDGLLEDGSTYLGYGAFLEAFTKEDSWSTLEEHTRKRLYMEWTVGLMKEVVIPTLTRYGINVNWDGDMGRRIGLQNADYYVALAPS
jgi:hypothetical protein